MASADTTADLSYVPGDWLGVVRAGTVVLLPPDTGRSLVDSLWSLLGRAPEIHEVLDTVTAASGGSLFRLPWFGVVGLSSPLRVFLRGDIDLHVRVPGAEPTALSGRDVTTWTERRLPSAEGFEVVLPAGPAGSAAAGSAAVASSARLPLGEGVVLLRGLHCTLGSGTPAMDDQLLAAAEADVAAGTAESDGAAEALESDIAAESGDHGSSADTVLELPEDLEPEPAAEPESEPAAEPETAPEQEPTGSYDHLWEQTVLRTIEEAAVREDPDADAEPAPQPPSSDADAPDPAAEPDPVSRPEAGPGQEPEPAPQQPAAPAAQAEPAPAVPTGLIDSVPWSTGGGRPASPAPATAAPAPASAPVPVHSPSPPSFSAALHRPEPENTDHDGQTIMKSALPAASEASVPAAQVKDPGTGPMVLARVCAQGHANPPTSAQCAHCGQALPGDGVQVRRPRLGRMRLSTGELIDLDQSLIIGRQPSVSRVQGAVMPKLIQVASPGGDISRSHVEVRLEGWHVMLCDLKATNGTVLLREGQAPRRLAQGEMAIVFDGDVAELGDGIQLRFEELL